MSNKTVSLIINKEKVADIELDFFDFMHVGGKIKYLAIFEKYRPTIEKYLSFRQFVDDNEEGMDIAEIENNYQILDELEESVSALGLFVQESEKEIEISHVCLEDGDTICYRNT